MPFHVNTHTLTSCNIVSDVPVITWVTQSPHLATKDVSDLLEVKIKNDKTLIRVDWYHNGTQIERNTEGFAFPGRVLYWGYCTTLLIKVQSIQMNSSIHQLLNTTHWICLVAMLDLDIAQSPFLWKKIRIHWSGITKHHNSQTDQEPVSRKFLYFPGSVCTFVFKSAFYR